MELMSKTDSNSQTMPASSEKSTQSFNRLRNLIIVAVAVILSTVVFFGTRTPSATASLSSLAESSTPFDLALSNQKPSLVEFYANWCTSCQAMAEDMADLRELYDDRVNFVMLNVDNSKWLPEVLQYRVDGIPHFVFMNDSGEAIASAIGEQPKSILTANLDALSSGQTLPYIQTKGRMSDVNAMDLNQSSVQDDPRSHGAQVVVD
jgi:thiol-disulfide isomerase/thioredoxin